MVSDAARRELFTALERGLGSGPAGTMMELLPPVGWADVARQSDLVAVRGEMAELRGELKGEMAGLRGEMAELRAEMKSDIALLTARVDGLLPKLVTANIASMVGMAGLVIGAARFL